MPRNLISCKVQVKSVRKVQIQLRIKKCCHYMPKCFLADVPSHSPFWTLQRHWPRPWIIFEQIAIQGLYLYRRLIHLLSLAHPPASLQKHRMLQS